MSEERTEPATPKRRKKAREDGQVARSTELVSAVVLIGMLAGARSALPALGRSTTDFFMSSLANVPIHADSEKLQDIAGNLFRTTGQLVLPALCLSVGLGVAVNLLQVGLSFTPKLLEPKASRVDLGQGIKRLFTPRAAFELLKGLLKVSLVGYVGWNYLSHHWEECYRLVGAEPGDIASRVGTMVYSLGTQMVGTLLGIAVLDYAWQRYEFEKGLRMTRQEVKDEMRDAEGNPETRQRIRQRQREFSRRRMMAEVPSATVVITNPTHYAVALRYEAGQSGAPRVVAKGQDKIALKIRELAKENDVPVIESPPLARALHAQVKLGEEIPAELYRAVAEILALIWRLETKRSRG